tara:strand:+ start:4132 stop:4659 length:528 start_codon:yes stop_codon:yes gene_type:complete
LKIISLFIIFYFFSFNLIAKNIAVVNVEYLIDNNPNYLEIIKRIEKSQKSILEDFNLKEKELKKLSIEIEESKLILSEEEINSNIDNYNNKLNDFSILVDSFNSHYQNEIINIRTIILNKIILLLEQYASKNDIELILDSKSYLIASNSLDITNNIFNELKESNIDLEYKDFETN